MQGCTHSSGGSASSVVKRRGSQVLRYALQSERRRSAAQDAINNRNCGAKRESEKLTEKEE